MYSGVCYHLINFYFLLFCMKRSKPTKITEHFWKCYIEICFFRHLIHHTNYLKLPQAFKSQELPHDNSFLTKLNHQVYYRNTRLYFNLYRALEGVGYIRPQKAPNDQPIDAGFTCNSSNGIYCKFSDNHGISSNEDST